MTAEKKTRRKGSSQKDIDERGKSIMQVGVVLDLGHGRYKVSSQSVTDAFYDVTVTDNCWRCTCAYRIHRNRRCKHISAVQDIVENIREAPGALILSGIREWSACAVMATTVGTVRRAATKEPYRKGTFAGTVAKSSPTIQDLWAGTMTRTQ